MFCLGAVWIGRQEYVDQHERFFQSTSVAQRMLSQKTVQHEAVLATLAALSHPPSPERLYPSLRPAMPQLLGLGHLPDGAWSGSVAEPPGLPVVELARPMSDSLHCVPVLDESRGLVGLVTQSDLVAALYQIAMSASSPVDTPDSRKLAA